MSYDWSDFAVVELIGRAFRRLEEPGGLASRIINTVLGTSCTWVILNSTTNFTSLTLYPVWKLHGIVVDGPTAEDIEALQELAGYPHFGLGLPDLKFTCTNTQFSTETRFDMEFHYTNAVARRLEGLLEALMFQEAVKT